MSEALARAAMLVETGRGDLAEQELHRHLGEFPDDGRGHAVLALAHLLRERYEDAEAAARRSVHLDPEDPFCHGALARVQLARNDHRSARASADHATRLEPDDPSQWTLLARIEIGAQRPREALVAADRAVALAPEDSDAQAARSIALSQLGRHHEAGSAAATALREGPDDDDAHSAAGWAALHAGDAHRARAHFAEALRLDATNESARGGLVEAIQATNPVYRVILRMFLVLARIGGRYGALLCVGIWVGYRAFDWIASSVPSLQPFATPATVLYLTFVAVTWLAQPLANLCLRLHPLGRHALSRDQRRASALVGGTLAAAALATLAGIAGPRFYALAIALTVAILLPAGVYSCSAGWPRIVGAVYAAGVVCAIAIGALVLTFSLEDSAGSHLGQIALAVSVVGTVIGTWLFTFLSAVTPRR